MGEERREKEEDDDEVFGRVWVPVGAGEGRRVESAPVGRKGLPRLSVLELLECASEEEGVKGQGREQGLTFCVANRRGRGPRLRFWTDLWAHCLWRVCALSLSADPSWNPSESMEGESLLIAKAKLRARTCSITDGQRPLRHRSETSKRRRAVLVSQLSWMCSMSCSTAQPSVSPFQLDLWWCLLPCACAWRRRRRRRGCLSYSCQLFPSQR